MKKFTEIREARRSAQDRLSARASKHGLGSQKRLDKIKKSADFFSKPPPSFSKAELKKMGYAVEASSPEKQAAIASSPEQQAAIAIAKKADKVVNEDINVKSIDMFKAAAKDFDKKKTTKYDNFDSISDALSTIAIQVRMLSKSTSGRTDVKAEKIISKQETRINNIINKTMYGKGGATEEGREIKKILSKHGLDRTFNGLIFDSVDEAYYRGQRKATPKKQEPPKMGSKSDSGYDLYHKSYSGALQHAYAWAKKKGHIVDPDDIDSKVASGPKKPSEGRTNSFTLKLKDNPKKMLAVQVYGMGGGKYELNTYIT